MEESKTKLILFGEGNFSFTLSLLARLSSSQIKNISIISTSFDSELELAKKYSNFTSIKADITSLCPQVQFFHSINATRDIASQFSSEWASFPPQADYIVFNFPHLGIEDCRAHRSFLFHFLDRCNFLLSNSDHSPIVCLGLAESQANRWDLEAAAQRTGFTIWEKIPIIAMDWPLYDLKRHQCGKSFAGRVKELFHYCLISSKKPLPSSNIFKDLFDEARSQLVRNDGNRSTLSTLEPSNQSTKYKKRKMHTLTADHYQWCSQTMKWRCLRCGKDFPKEQGARNHVFVMHVDAKDEDHSRSNASTEAVHPSSIATLGMIEVDTLCTPENQATMASKSSLPSYSNYRCEICQINFSEEANLLQHQLSKHGEFDISKHKLGTAATRSIADLSSSSPSLEATQDPTESRSYQCRLCEWTFPTETEYLEHIEQGWIPVVSNVQLTLPQNRSAQDGNEHVNTVSLQCPQCNKCFHELRALHQHRNYCGKKELV